MSEIWEKLSESFQKTIFWIDQDKNTQHKQSKETFTVVEFVEFIAVAKCLWMKWKTKFAVEIDIKKINQIFCLHSAFSKL